MKIHRVLILTFALALASGSAGAAQQFELSRKDIRTEGHPSRGPADAPVTIVEFGDFECPFCAGLHPTLQAVRRNYPDQVRIVFRQFPLIFYAPVRSEGSRSLLVRSRAGSFLGVSRLPVRESGRHRRPRVETPGRGIRSRHRSV